jgi:hypothetical protein
VKQVQQIEAPEAESYFAALFDACGISAVPANWRERVLVGADRRQSGTARENLSGILVALPEVLPDKHKRMIEYVAPGLRAVLGYNDG